MEKKDHPLVTAARRGLRLHHGHGVEIAREARVSYSWLGKISSGAIRNPRIEQLQRLLDVLAARPVDTLGDGM